MVEKKSHYQVATCTWWNLGAQSLSFPTANGSGAMPSERADPTSRHIRCAFQQARNGPRHAYRKDGSMALETRNPEDVVRTIVDNKIEVIDLRSTDLPLLALPGAAAGQGSYRRLALGSKHR